MVSAWVFVVWGKPKYLIGAIACAASLRQVNTCHQIVLLWANMDDLELLNTVKKSKLFNKVQKTELLRFEVNPLKTKKQMELYGGEFSETANTKWQCLSLDQYEKVMFLDSDLIFRRNCDFLFSLNAPAATFSSPFSATYSKGGFPDFYRKIRHGQHVPAELIRQGLKSATVCAGSMVLLEPSTKMQQAHIEWMHSHEPYGHSGNYSAIDEQAIAEFMLAQGKMWTQISPIYQAIPWKDKWGAADLPHGINILDPEKGAFALHFYHDRPFETGKGTGWPDTKIWWAVWYKFAKKYPKLEKIARPLMGHYESP